MPFIIYKAAAAAATSAVVATAPVEAPVPQAPTSITVQVPVTKVVPIERFVPINTYQKHCQSVPYSQHPVQCFDIPQTVQQKKVVGFDVYFFIDGREQKIIMQQFPGPFVHLQR